ncbi:MAG: septum formation initiator family protein [Pseudomonadota bacterium]
MLRDLSITQIIIPALTMLAISGVVAFGHSGLYGSYGLSALQDARHQERAMQAEKSDLVAERKRVRNLVERLGPKTLDLDLLDERVRRVLGQSRDDEIIIR